MTEPFVNRIKVFLSYSIQRTRLFLLQIKLLFIPNAATQIAVHGIRSKEGGNWKCYKAVCTNTLDRKTLVPLCPSVGSCSALALRTATFCLHK